VQIPLRLVRPILLAATTPTGAETLRSCFARVAFDAVPQYQEYVFTGPTARLGTICHALLEAAGSGCFDGLPPDQLRVHFERLWQEQAARQEKELKQSPLERHFGPVERWPNYAIKKAFLLLRIKEVTGARSRAGRDFARPGPSPDRVEQSLAGFGGRLRGRVDRVVERDGRVEIEDYKTGAIYETGREGSPELRAGYRRQALLYAALYRDVTGTWPAAAHIVSLGGERVTVDIEPRVAQALAQETLDLLDRYNRKVASGATVEQLAQPSSTACPRCPYQAICTPFWEAVAGDWETLKGGAWLAGTVAGTQDFGPSGWVIEVDSQQGNLAPGRYRLRALLPARFPDITSISAGAHIRLVNAWIENREAPRDLLPTPYTQLWFEARQGQRCNGSGGPLG